MAALRPAHSGRGDAGSVPVIWAAPYEGVPRELIASLKFRGRIELARLAGGAIAAAVAGAGLDLCGRVVVPVPAAPLRLRRRGFDPGELIATVVAAELGAPISRCLARRSGRRQVGRSRRARLAQPPRVRAVGDVPRFALIVDDVFTTGATLGSCAAALRAAGCRDLAAAVFARAA